MKRKAIFLLLILFVFPFILAMGSQKGEIAPEKIPVPVKKFKVIFIDITDTITECTEVSIEGGTFIEGKRGEGIHNISFDNISNIIFFLKEGMLTGIVKLKDGNILELSLNKDQRAYGRTKYGTFQIRLSDLKKMTFDISRKQN